MIIRELLTKFGISVDKAKLDKWDKNIDNSRKGLSKLDDKYQKFATHTKMKIGQGLESMVGKMNGFNARIEQSFGGVLRPMREMANQIPLVGSLLSGLTPVAIATGLAIFGIVKAIQGISAATRKFIDFESGMKSVQRVTLASADDMGKLEKAALKAGEASIFTVSQAAEAEKFLAQAGLKVDEVIGALPGTLQLAAAANIDLGRAADIATDIMSAQGIAVTGLTRINDMLVKSATLATTTVEGLGSGFATVGVEAKLAGIEIETLGAALGIQASAGQKNELGGTLFRNMINELKSKKVKKAMAKAGVNIANYLNEATGKFTNFEGLIAKLGELDEVALNTFVGGGFDQSSRGKRALLALVSSSDKFIANLAEIRASSGIAAQASEVAFQGLGGQIALFKSKMETAMISFMKDSGLAGIFEDVVAIAVQLLPPLVKGLGVLLSPLGAIVKGFTSLLRFASVIIGGVAKPIINTASKLIDIIKIFLAPLTTIIGRVLSGAEKFFGVMGDVEDGPMSGLLGLLEKWAKGWSDWAHGILKEMNPFLEVMDILLNVFLLRLPGAAEKFNAALNKLAENSLFFKVVKFLVGDIDAGDNKKEEGSAGAALGINTNKIKRIFDPENVGNTLAQMFPNAASATNSIGESLTSGLEYIGGLFSGPTGNVGGPIGAPIPAFAGMPSSTNNTTNTNSRQIHIGEIKTDVIIGGTDAEPAEIATQINDKIAAQLNDLLQEHE